MIELPQSIKELIRSFKELPGIGAKTAERLAYYVFEKEYKYSSEFATNLDRIHKNIEVCNICFFLFERGSKCICETSQDRSVLCVVQKPKDVIAFDKTGFKGMYHIIGGVLSPLDSIGPDDLNIDSLLDRVDSSLNEVILATDTSLEGDATSIYISNLFHEKYPNIKISRLARGIPSGGQFEFIDDITLMRAFNDRTQV